MQTSCTHRQRRQQRQQEHGDHRSFFRSFPTSAVQRRASGSPLTSNPRGCASQVARAGKRQCRVCSRCRSPLGCGASAAWCDVMAAACRLRMSSMG
ncbi:hypothetical protein AOLI_G00164040 [Acnodon oligacanthus]